MKFKNEGIAFAHLTLPPDSFAQEAAALAEELDRLGKEYADNRIAYLTGQSDLLLELRLSDLRLAFRLEYKSSATGTNWLFAIPFDHVLHRGTSATDLALTYVIHLRVNRDLYRTSGAEIDNQIVAATLGLARGRLTAEVSAGFGWSDLLVSGTFTKRSDFVAFLTGLHHMRIGTSSPQDAFRRILTIIGYDRNTNFARLESHEVVHPVIFARSLPTHIGAAADFIEWRGGGSWRKVVVDGKWDLIIFLNNLEGVPAKGFLEHHHRLITGGKLTKAGIQRLETHLLSQEATERDGGASDQHDAIAKACNYCSSAVRDERELLGDPNKPDSSASLLPRSLVIAIRNVLNLFRAASRDGNTCCDIVPSLVRCEIGLDRLLRHHRSLHQRMLDVAKIDTAPGSPSAAQWSPHVVKARNDIEAWCTYAERIVSQRTVGRFEEFLAQNERVVSYRGGIQKLLYLADALLNSYAHRVYSPPEEPAFMSLYDPIDLVESMRVVGFVRVPVRYVFVLPLTIAHLWHEVGVHWFYSKYWNPVDRRSREHIFVDLARIPSDELGNPSERVDLLIDLADVYGDAVTLNKGFRGDLTKFIVSLGSTLLEADAFISAPGPVQARFLVQLLMRLYLGVEFNQRCSFVRSKLHTEAMSLDRLELESWVPDRTVFVVPAVARLAAALRKELLSKPRYKAFEFAITPEIESAAVDTIGNVVNSIHRHYLNELAWEIAAIEVGEPSPATFEALEGTMRGEVLTLGADVDLNDLFMLVQQHLIRELCDRPFSVSNMDNGAVADTSFLAPVAALVRSSLLAFYQRDRGERPAVRPRSQESKYRGPLMTAAGLDLFDDEDGNA